MSKSHHWGTGCAPGTVSGIWQNNICANCQKQNQDADIKSRKSVVEITKLKTLRRILYETAPLETSGLENKKQEKTQETVFSV